MNVCSNIALIMIRIPIFSIVISWNIILNIVHMNAAFVVAVWLLVFMEEIVEHFKNELSTD